MYCMKGDKYSTTLMKVNHFQGSHSICEQESRTSYILDGHSNLISLDLQYNCSNGEITCEASRDAVGSLKPQNRIMPRRNLCLIKSLSSVTYVEFKL